MEHLSKINVSKLQDHLIQFMRLQICAHHPFGAHEDSEGGWSSSVNHWKVCFIYVFISHHLVVQSPNDEV